MNSRVPENSAKSTSTQDAEQPNLNLFTVLAAFDLLQRKANNNFKTFYDSLI
jgi:hypothetical protein